MKTAMTRYFEEVEQYFIGKETEEVTECLVCGTHYESTYDNNPNYYQCKCGFVWRSHQPTQKVLDDFYTESKPMTSWSKIKKQPREAKRQFNKYSVVYKYMDVNNCRSIMDYGCGNGFFLNDVNFPKRKVGIEVNKEAIRYCNFPVYENLIEMGKEEKEPFDIVTAFGVLEHYKDPIYMLQSLATCIRENGSLIIIVPNVDSLVVKYLRTKCSTFCPQHLWYFNKSSLNKLVKGAIGYDPVENWTIEPESQVIARYVSGLDPYEDLGGYNLKDPRYDPEMIISFNLGYKLCAVYKKS